MTTQNRTVIVEQLPQLGSRKQAQAFLRELKSSMSIVEPRVVLDCSPIRQMNASLVYILLCCLEETLKRNGDLKLAALGPAALAVLNTTGVDRVFEIHNTIPEALESFLERRAPRRSQPATHGDLVYERARGAERSGSAAAKVPVGSGGINEHLGVLATATDC